MKCKLATINGFIDIDGEIGDHIYHQEQENKRLRKEISDLKLYTFDLEWKLKRKWWFLWLF